MLHLLALLALTVSPVNAAETLECRQVPMLVYAFLSGHYQHRNLTDQLRERTVEQFIKFLDPSKTLFLESDVKTLRKDLPALFNTMPKGDCAQLEAVHKLQVERTKANEDFVRGLLGKSYKLDETAEFIADAEKRGFPKTAADRDKLLTALAHFQISNYQIAKSSLEKAKLQLIKRHELMTKRLKEQGSGQLINLYAEAFAQALDPHSSYLSSEELKEFQIQMQLSLEGIGASLTSEDGYTVVQEVIPGGSADRDKTLRSQDKIIAVAQGSDTPVSVIDMDLKDVVKLIRGKKGTKVRLTILRQSDKSETFELTLTRQKVDIQESAAKISYVTRKSGGKDIKIGVLDLPSFYGSEGSRSSYKDVKDLLVEARKEKVDGLVLDLSRNGGGLLQDAVRISGLFIRKGPIVATQDTQKQKDVFQDEDSEVVYTGPLVVLTSRVSASASEILAGALKDYHRAVIVGGDHTFGKGSVQFLTQLPMGLGAMKYTTGMYFLPKGASTQHQGVSSDIILPSIFDNDDIGEKTLPYSLPPMAIDAFDSKDANGGEGAQKWDEVTSSLVSKLSSQSKDRVAKSTEFQDLLKEMAEMEKNKSVVKLADLRKRSEKDQKKIEKEKKLEAAKRRELNLETPQAKEAVNIMADWIALRSQKA